MEKKKKGANANPVVAERLRMLRAKANRSQTEIADKLGITQQTYSKYENGCVNPDSKDIIKLCGIYGVTSDYILGLDKEAGRSGKRRVAADTTAYETSENNATNALAAQAIEGNVSEEQIRMLVRKVLEEMAKGKKDI